MCGLGCFWLVMALVSQLSEDMNNNQFQGAALGAGSREL
jgi:hypothetical protein